MEALVRRSYQRNGPNGTMIAQQLTRKNVPFFLNRHFALAWRPSTTRRAIHFELGATKRPASAAGTLGAPTTAPAAATAARHPASHRSMELLAGQSHSLGL